MSMLTIRGDYDDNEIFVMLVVVIVMICIYDNGYKMINYKNQLLIVV